MPVQRLRALAARTVEVLLPVSCALALVVLPALTRGVVHGRWSRSVGVVFDGAVMLAGLWGLLFVGRAWTRANARVPSWRSHLLAGGWSVLVFFELLRAASRYATNEDLPAYDLALLARHLWVLGHDVVGAWADVALAGAVVLPVVLYALGLGLFAGVEAAIRGVGPRRSGLALVGLFVGVLAASPLPGSRWVAPALVRNASSSAALWWSVRRDLASRPHRELEDVVLRRRPDVIVYIVESYGDVVRTTDLVDRWSLALDGLSARLEDGGWVLAAGRSRAPVHGGRSWIADASLLTGLYIARQATFEHVVSMVDRLPTLPRFLHDRGYETVLVRPKDRARPGVGLVNHFGFDRTVFFDDLAYVGPVVGWGHIPDQYTVGFVQERVLDEIQQPTFAFFHLATAHMPWSVSPPVLEHWSDWQRAEGEQRPVFDEREAWSEARMRMSRFKSRDRGRRTRIEGDPDDYLDVILYDLEVITRQLEAGPRGDQLVIVMGDHQPPIVAQGLTAEVPVHVLASDPTLVKAFYDAGFVPGMEPIGVGPSALEHRDLFAVIVRALVRADKDAYISP